MSNDSSLGGRTGSPSREDLGTLRAELAQVRAEAEQELARLREELASVRGVGQPERDVDTVTESIALQQEIDTLRHALREKERIIDATAAQCRRLEDELEDQHLAYDGLKQDLERKKLTLAVAQEQMVRLTRERQVLDAGSQAFANATSPAAIPAAVPDLAIQPRRSGGNRRLLTGMAAGLVMGAGITLLLPAPPWFGSGQSGLAGGTGYPPTTVAATEQPPAETMETAPETILQSTEEPGADGGGGTQPVALRNVRDRLAGGNPGPLMIAIQGGRFTMGKLRAVPSEDEGPAHEVELGGFLIGATEVTFEDYDRFVRATNGRFPSDFGWGRGRRPVVDVSWEDAQAYASWLSRQTGKRYRLPSEAEWEYAAAAGRRTPFWWGFRPEQGRAACFDCGTLWDNRSTAPVGSFDPNPLGLYDTAGNALEWVEDCYQHGYGGAPTDGRPRVEPDCPFRVARGGSFNKPADSMRSTARHSFDRGTRLNMLGFRVARDE